MGQLRESEAEGCQGGRKALGTAWEGTWTAHGAVAGLHTELEATCADAGSHCSARQGRCSCSLHWCLECLLSPLCSCRTVLVP